MDIIGQLGELFLAAIPTVVIVFLFYLFMRWSFFKPMERVLSERHKRAEGAQQEAEASRVAVQEKTRAYTETLKKSRAEIFVEQERTRHKLLEERQAAIGSARAEAQENLQVAKKELAANVEAVRGQLDQSTVILADEIADAILSGESSGPGNRPSGAGR